MPLLILEGFNFYLIPEGFHFLLIPRECNQCILELQNLLFIMHRYIVYIYQNQLCIDFRFVWLVVIVLLLEKSN
jgi:hypothetical protein